MHVPMARPRSAFINALPRWLHGYNWHRPHASSAGQPPTSGLSLDRNNLLGLHGEVAVFIATDHAIADMVGVRIQEIVFDAVADGALSIPSELYAATWKYQVACARPSTTYVVRPAFVIRTCCCRLPAAVP